MVQHIGLRIALRNLQIERLLYGGRSESEMSAITVTEGGGGLRSARARVRVPFRTCKLVRSDLNGVQQWLP